MKTNVSTVQLQELFRNYCEGLVERCKGAYLSEILEQHKSIRALINLASRLYPEAEDLREYEKQCEQCFDDVIQSVYCESEDMKDEWEIGYREGCLPQEEEGPL